MHIACVFVRNYPMVCQKSSEPQAMWSALCWTTKHLLILHIHSLCSLPLLLLLAVTKHSVQMSTGKHVTLEKCWQLSDWLIAVTWGLGESTDLGTVQVLSYWTSGWGLLLWISDSLTID